MLYHPACMLATLPNSDYFFFFFFLQEARDRPASCFPSRWRLIAPLRLFAQSWVLSSVGIPLLCIQLICHWLKGLQSWWVWVWQPTVTLPWISGSYQSSQALSFGPCRRACICVVGCQGKTGAKAFCKCCCFLLLVSVSVQNQSCRHGFVLGKNRVYILIFRARHFPEKPVSLNNASHETMCAEQRGFHRKKCSGVTSGSPFPLMSLWISLHYVSLLCCCPVENTWTQGTNAIVCPWLWRKRWLLSLQWPRCCFYWSFGAFEVYLKATLIHF